MRCYTVRSRLYFYGLVIFANVILEISRLLLTLVCDRTFVYYLCSYRRLIIWMFRSWKVDAGGQVSSITGTTIWFV